MTQTKWSERVLAQWDSITVTEYIDGVQQLYKKWMVVCVIIVTGGAATIAVSSNPRLVAFGLFLAMTGIINITVTKLWVHTKLSMIRIIYELQKKNHAHSI